MQTTAAILITLLLLNIQGALAGPPSWAVVPSNFQYNANITSVVFINDIPVQDSMNVMGAFFGDSLRGVASPMKVDETWMYFLTVYSNVARGELLNFHIYDASSDTILETVEQLTFVTDTLIGDPINPFEFHAQTGSSDTQITLNVESGWNMISLPLNVIESGKNILFPTSISSAFFFSNGYQSSNTLQHGVGYWLKFPADSGLRSVTITGAERTSDTIDVSAGWNLLGSISSELPANSIQPIGTTISSPWFEFQNGYLPSDTLKPGRGYWIKVTSAGSLLMTKE